jgi:hypothetical protein
VTSSSDFGFDPGFDSAPSILKAAVFMTLATDHRLSVTALCLMIAAAGWYYLFYSRAAHRLGAIEAADANRWRVLLRRCNGLLMMALAALVYIAAASQIP